MFQLMRYTQSLPGAIDPAQLGLAELVEELGLLDRALAEDREERGRQGATATQRATEWRENVGYMKRTWGDAYTAPGPPSHLAEAEAAVADLDERIAALAQRRVAVLAALSTRVAEEEAAIAAATADLDERERGIAARTARLRELTAPLLAFEHYPHADGLLPLAGETGRQMDEVYADRRRLATRRATLSRARRDVAAPGDGEGRS